MKSEMFHYPITIKEVYLDTFGHVNNATYLVLFEEARWDLITQNGYGLNKIRESGIGPTILEIKMNFLKELRLREEIMIETQVVSYENKVGTILQKMFRNDELCCTAEFITALFDLNKRKIIAPTDEWLKAIGVINPNQ